MNKINPCTCVAPTSRLKLNKEQGIYQSNVRDCVNDSVQVGSKLPFRAECVFIHLFIILSSTGFIRRFLLGRGVVQNAQFSPARTARIKLNWQLLLVWVCEAVGVKSRSLSKVYLFPVGSLNQTAFGSSATCR